MCNVHCGTPADISLLSIIEQWPQKCRERLQAKNWINHKYKDYMLRMKYRWFNKSWYFSLYSASYKWNIQQKSSIPSTVFLFLMYFGYANVHSIYISVFPFHYEYTIANLQTFVYRKAIDSHFCANLTEDFCLNNKKNFNYGLLGSFSSQNC